MIINPFMLGVVTRLRARAVGLRADHNDLTIEEIVADPIVCDLMRADHIEPCAFEKLLRSVAARSATVDHATMNGTSVGALTWIKAKLGAIKLQLHPQIANQAPLHGRTVWPPRANGQSTLPQP